MSSDFRGGLILPEYSVPSFHVADRSPPNPANRKGVTQMPYVHVQLIEGRDDDIKRKIGEAITEALGAYANAAPETCSIVFQDVNANHWMNGGQTIAAKRRAK